MPAIASVRRFGVATGCVICHNHGPKTTNPKPLDFGSLRSACKEFPNFCRPMLVVNYYSAAIVTVTDPPWLASVRASVRSALDFNAASAVDSPAT